MSGSKEVHHDAAEVTRSPPNPNKAPMVLGDSCRAFRYKLHPRDPVEA